jgi:Tetratricopeptide repeat/FecR protein
MVERHLLDVVRHAASDAVRLEVEEHLGDCAACRQTRAAFGLVGLVKDQPPPRLGVSAERRIVARLVAGQGAKRPAVASHRTGPLGFAGLALAVVGVVVVVLAPGRPTHWQLEQARQAAIQAHTLEGQTLEADRPGVLVFAGAGVTYDRGTHLTFHPATRTLVMARGEVDVDVTEHLSLHFRVTTPGFVVEVLGTRFVVTPAGVRTLRGHVRVLDLEGHELAVVPAGESWTVPVPVVAPVVAVPVAAVAPPAPRAEAPAPKRPGVSVTDLVSLARSALAEGDATRARALLGRAVAEGPGPSERPAVELLSADTLLVARRPDEAIAAYRGVLRRHAGTPEGETAAFAVGQLLLERGAQAEAGAALNDYLARYPHGRFVREARERLAQIHATP